MGRVSTRSVMRTCKHQGRRNQRCSSNSPHRSKCPSSTLLPRSMPGAVTDCFSCWRRDGTGGQQAHHLEVLAAGDALHEVGPRAHIVDDGPLEPGDHQVRALRVHLRQRHRFKKHCKVETKWQDRRADLSAAINTPKYTDNCKSRTIYCTQSIQL